EELISHEFEKFTDEDEWIDKIEEQDKAETYYTEEEKAKKILLNNYQIFAENISKEEQTLELGQTKEVCYKIDTPDAKPIKQ
ncbi:25355_t:CDS:2, partial [Racocetra persica]